MSSNPPDDEQVERPKRRKGSNRIDSERYYTAREAAEVLSRNSGKNISRSYIRRLVKRGELTSKRVNSKVHLYLKSQIDKYVIVKYSGDRNGFASMNQERVREISSKGGKAAHAMGRAHTFTHDEAVKAGKKGGSVTGRMVKNRLKNDGGKRV
jgi:hypothetical protein